MIARTENPMGDVLIRCGSPMCSRPIGSSDDGHRSPLGRCSCALPAGHLGHHRCDTPNGKQPAASSPASTPTTPTDDASGRGMTGDPT